MTKQELLDKLAAILKEYETPNCISPIDHVDICFFAKPNENPVFTWWSHLPNEWEEGKWAE